MFLRCFFWRFQTILLLGLAAATRLSEERPKLEEQLKRLTKRGSQGHMKYRFSSRLPRFSDLFCFPTHGKDSEENFICYVENVCVEIDGGKLWISKDGVRENLPAKLQMSSYREHKTLHKITYYEYDSKTINDTNAVYINNPTFLYKRIGPRNMMHALHDDIIPLIATISNLEEFEEGNLQDKILFVAADGFDFKLDPYGPYEVLGQAMELEQIPYKVAGPFKHRDLKYVCFENAYVGLETSTTWYHYGFKRMQGPIEEVNREAVGRNVRLITNWIVNQLADLHKKPKSLQPIAAPKEYFAAWREGRELPNHPKPLISVIVRSKTRKMLNEKDLLKDLTVAFPQAIIQVLDEERQPHHELIHLASRSVALIGMHGALMSMAMFLPPGAALIELFPFGIPAENYTPYKTLAHLGSYNLHYRSWVNPYEDAPFNQGHPEAVSYYGGLQHLPASYAAGVLATKTVPKHICCYSPFWIYRIFQDTWVDANEIIKMVRSA